MPAAVLKGGKGCYYMDAHLASSEVVCPRGFDLAGLSVSLGSYRQIRSSFSALLTVHVLVVELYMLPLI